MIKVILLIILCFGLAACEEETLEVRETKRGYTIEEIATLPGSTSYFIWSSNRDDILYYRYYDQDVHFYYEINLENKQVVAIEEDVIYDMSEETCDQCKYGYISSERSILKDGEEQIGFHVTYYSQQNGEKKILYEKDMYYNDTDGRTSTSIGYDLTGEHLYLLDDEENNAVLYEREDDDWKEIKSFPYEQNGYTLYSCYMIYGELQVEYRNDENIWLILQDEEYILDIDESYRVFEDYILVEHLNEQKSQETTYLIDRNTQKIYDLNRIIDMDGIFLMSYEEAIFIYPDTKDSKTYCIASIRDLKMTIYDTPFELNFRPGGIEEKRALFLVANEDQNTVTVYLLTLEE